MKLTLSNSEYNFITKVLKKDINNIFTNKFKEYLKNQLNKPIKEKINCYDVFDTIHKVAIIKSILNKLK